MTKQHKGQLNIYIFHITDFVWAHALLLKLTPGRTFKFTLVYHRPHQASVIIFNSDVYFYAENGMLLLSDNGSENCDAFFRGAKWRMLVLLSDKLMLWIPKDCLLVLEVNKHEGMDLVSCMFLIMSLGLWCVWVRLIPCLLEFYNTTKHKHLPFLLIASVPTRGD